MKTARLHRPGLLLVVCLFIAWQTVFPQNPEDHPVPPPAAPSFLVDSIPAFSAERIFREAAHGFVFGFLGSVVFGLAGGLAASGQDDFWTGMEIVGIGVIAGSAIGSSAAVYKVGRDDGEKGTYSAALIGALAGTALFLGTKPFESDSFPWPTLYGLPALGSVIGYNLSSRRQKTEAGEGAVFLLHGGRLTLHLPEPRFSRSVRPRPCWTGTVDLARIRL